MRCPPIATSALAAGTHTVSATYNGDGNVNGSTGVLAGGQIVVPLELDMGTGGIDPNSTSFFTPVILKQ